MTALRFFLGEDARPAMLVLAAVAVVGLGRRAGLIGPANVGLILALLLCAAFLASMVMFRQQHK